MKDTNMRLSNLEGGRVGWTIGGSASTGADSVELGEIKTKLGQALTRVEKLENGESTGSVSYGGVEWDDPDDAGKWLREHLSIEDAGLIVDPHTVMEHVFGAVSSGKFLDQFQKLYKLQIDNIAQGYSMTSYENAIPKFFGSGRVKVIKGNESYLDRMLVWDDWDHTTTGLRAVLMKELTKFSTSHTKMVRTNLKWGSPGYNLAILTAAESISVVEAVIKFIDDFMKSLTEGKYSTVKALHVTSRLVVRIMEGIFKPRDGVLKYFRTGQMDQITASILFTSLQSLSVANDMKAQGLEDLDSKSD